MTIRPRFTADEIKSGLQGRILELCAHLLPSGKNDGSHWLAGSVLGEKGQSLRVMLVKGDAGRWKDFSSGESGNVLGLAKAVHYPNDRKWDRTLQWAAFWLGWADASPDEIERLKSDAKRRQVEAARESEDRCSRYQAAARRIFFAAEAKLAGTPAESYLTGRGIDPAYWRAVGPGWPRSLRFAPELLHGKSGLVGPALVAAITDLAGRVIAVHRTWLEPDGADGWRKVAELGREAKMTLGQYKPFGGFIRLRRGATGRRWQDMGEAGAESETVYVTEGIEDALTLAMAKPEARIACAVSLGSLANARFKGLGQLVIVADNDGDNAAAARGLAAAVAAQRERGCRVKLLRPPAEVKDLNDWLRGTA